jgi:hypothetical protein
MHANPSDPVLWRGRVSVYEHAVFLESDFEVGPGPALIRSSFVKETIFVYLGGLRAFKGSQGYAIPVGVDPMDYPTVIIWCERFGSRAALAGCQGRSPWGVFEPERAPRLLRGGRKRR